MTNAMFDNKTAIALGFFDGLHSAHIQVIKKTVDAKREKGFLSCVLLFDKHPQSVIDGINVPFLCTADTRTDILNSLGVVALYEHFEGIKDMSPEEFVRDILVKKFNAGFVCCGYNYHFGKNGIGNADTLKELGNKYGVEVCVCEKIEVEKETVSSSSIREAIKNGYIEKANKMLGRPFSFSAEVFDGDHRGRLLGAPTINQYLPEGLIVPKFGVYASVSIIEGSEHPSVTNIGNRPTFDGKSVRSETFIIDYSGNLYGQTVEVRLFSFLREEKKFADFDALKTQISLDAAKARAQIEKLKK